MGEADEDDGEPSRWERLAALRLGQRLMQPGGTVLLFDECEDLFAAASTDDEGNRIAGSRVSSTGCWNQPAPGDLGGEHDRG